MFQIKVVSLDVNISGNLHKFCVRFAVYNKIDNLRL